jgi:tRNA-(ms[2]io[6]A)-hydroxylase
VARVEREPLALLSDHAHCELKAAASAQALLARNAENGRLVRALTEIAIEELEHFGRVLEELERRGGTLRRTAASPYAEGLLQASAADRRDPLLDRLLVASLIEARSLERFRLLAEHLADRGLAALYESLSASEARHRALFVRLARELYPAREVEVRSSELASREGRLVAGLPFAYRMHSGLADAEE